VRKEHRGLVEIYGTACFRGERRHILSKHMNCSGEEGGQSGNPFEEGGLADSGGPYQQEALSPLHLEVDVR
jgi:hypothetical protein